MTTPKYAIQIKDVEKTYGSTPPVEALKKVSFSIPRGTIFGLLGPNGAGKSTLINMMAGLVIKTAGTIKLWGYDIDKRPRQSRASIGIVPQEVNMDSFLTCAQILDFQAGLYGVPPAQRRTEELLDIMSLSDKAHTNSRLLSGGMRRRLMIAKSMVHSPPILVLDEPTAGVDVELRQELWTHVRKLNKQGVTVLLTTHYLEEAQELCDQIAIINHGEVVALDATKNLIKRLDQKDLILHLKKPVKAVPKKLKAFNAQRINSHTLRLHYQPSQVDITEILSAACAADLVLHDISTEDRDLEDVFLTLTRRA